MANASQKQKAPQAPNLSGTGKTTKVKPIRGIPTPQSSQVQPIPHMIHVQQSNMAALRTNVTSPQESVKRGDARGAIHIERNQQHPLALSGDHWRKSQHDQMVPSKPDQQQNADMMLNDSKAWHEAETPVATVTKGIVAEDRVAKIAEKISKLNTTLLQFQTDIEEQKKDPMLKSTHRSTASKKGLASQKSRDTNMTMQVVNAGLGGVGGGTEQGIAVPAHVRGLQDKRLLAQLQSAPGRSRAKMTNPNYDGGMVVPGSALIKQSTKKEELVKQEHVPTVEGTVMARGYTQQMISPSKRSVELPTEKDMQQSQLMDVAESQIDDLSVVETPMIRSGKLSQHIV